MSVEEVRNAFRDRGIVPSWVKAVGKEVHFKVPGAQRAAAIELALELNVDGPKIIIV